MSGYRGSGQSLRAHGAKARRRGRVLGARHPIRRVRATAMVFASVIVAAAGFVGPAPSALPTWPTWAGGIMRTTSTADYFPTYPVPDFATGIFPDFPADLLDPVGNSGSNNIGNGNTGNLNIGDGNIGSSNIGSGNIGSDNFGSGNFGSGNFGSGNSGNHDVGSGNGGGDGNIGWANQGSDNFGFANTGSNNIGFGNTGNNDIGFGNTGNNDFGIGCTGDNEVGFCGLNSSTGNTGLFNSGTDNSGFGNSGSNNTGIGNSGSYNIGYANTGIDNEGVGSSGENNVGSYDTGIGNIGDKNSGNSNIGIGNSVVGNAANGGNPGDGNTGLTNGNYTESVPNPDAGNDGIATVPLETHGTEIHFTVPASITDPTQVIQDTETTTVTATTVTINNISVAPPTIGGSATVAQDLSQSTTICASLADGCGGQFVQVSQAPTTPGDYPAVFEPIDGHNDLGFCVLPGGCDIPPTLDPIPSVGYDGSDFAEQLDPLASILNEGQSVITTALSSAFNAIGVSGSLAGFLIILTETVVEVGYLSW